jgi:hypothetical protein
MISLTYLLYERSELPLAVALPDYKDYQNYKTNKAQPQDAGQVC